VVPLIGEPARARFGRGGHGGDRLGTFNIRDDARNHRGVGRRARGQAGNRAVTRDRHADVIEALGLSLDLTPEQTPPCFASTALRSSLHPVSTRLSNTSCGPEAVAERGQRTIFNFSRPALEPGPPVCSLVGVPRPEMWRTPMRAGSSNWVGAGPWW